MAPERENGRRWGEFADVPRDADRAVPKQRRAGGMGPKIERIYITQAVSPSRPLQQKPPPPILNHGQKKDRDSANYRSSLPSLRSPDSNRSSLARAEPIRHLPQGLPLPLPCIVSHLSAAQEWPLQKGVRARRPLLRRRRRHRLRQQAGWPAPLPVRLRRCHHHRRTCHERMSASLSSIPPLTCPVRG